MHEYSIVQSLIDTCDDYLKEHGAQKVTKIVLKVGVLSGIEPHLLENAFDTFKDGTVCSKAKLVLNIQKVKVHCNDCGIELELEKNNFVCPDCESCNLSVLDGEEMYLMQLELE